MLKKVSIIFLVISALFIIFNFNTSNAVTSGDYTYEVKTDGTIKITAYNGTAENFNIPSTIDGKKVTELGFGAFEGVKIKNLTIPSTITRIDHRVFADSQIETVTIPSTVTSMGSAVFSGNTTLKTATINANIDTLPNATFSGCSNLTKVTLASNINTLDLQAFVYCSNLKDLSFLNTVEHIGQQCFSFCYAFDKVVIPPNVKIIDNGAFEETVNVDLSKTRLVKFGEYYAIGTEITTEGTYNYDYAYRVLDLVNQQRKANGLSELTMDQELLDAAMLRSAELSVYYSHDRPTGLTCFSASSTLNMAGENIAMYQFSPEEVMTDWINSPDHRANILNSGYKSIGIGCFYQNGAYHWVQCFGRNLQQEAKRPSNSTGEKRIYVGDDYINLSLSTENVRVRPGQTATVTIKNNNVKSNSNCATWTSSNTGVAIVDKNGNIKGIKNGETTITVKLGLDTKSITVFVQQFEDVKKGDWYLSAINYCYERGIILGATETEFRPTKNITRGMIVTILWRMEGEPVVTGVKDFPDVNTTEYYAKAVRWASKNGVVNGYNNGTFGPNDNITREQLATILCNYAKYKGKNVNITADTSKFVDWHTTTGYARLAMNWAIATGVITGKYEGTKVDPQGTASRAEAASMIYKYCTKVK